MFYVRKIIVVKCLKLIINFKYICYGNLYIIKSKNSFYYHLLLKGNSLNKNVVVIYSQKTISRLKNFKLVLFILDNLKSLNLISKTF